MPSRYASFNFQLRDRSGNILPGTQVTVIDDATGVAAAIYASDGLVTQLPNPITSDDNGMVSFYAGTLVGSYTVRLAEGGVFYALPADTVENHRQDPNHAAGSIDTSEINFDFTDTDVIMHASRNKDTHGLGATSCFAGTKAGTSSVSTTEPYFDAVQSDDTRAAPLGYLQGYLTCECTKTSIVAAIAAASDGDTVLVDGRTGGATPELDVSGGTITINKAITLRGIGGVRANVTGANDLFTVNAGGDVVIQGFNLVRTGGASGTFVTVRNSISTRLTDFYCAPNSGKGTYAVYVNQDINSGALYLDNCSLNGEAGALRVNTANFGVFATRSLFYTSSLTDYAVALIKGSGDPESGSQFLGCVINGAKYALYVDSRNCKFMGCYVLDSSGVGYAANVTANGTDCYLPSSANTIVGTITGTTGNIVGNVAGFDYDSGWVDFDNSAGALGTNEYFYHEFTHNLGSKLLEAKVFIADDASGSNLVWAFDPSARNFWRKQGSNEPHTNVAEMGSLVYPSTNVARLIMYAGEVSSGAGTTTDGNYIWCSINNAAIANNVAADDYDYTGGAGQKYKQVWVRVLLRKLD